MTDQAVFRASPFSLVADSANAECWAGRTPTRVQLGKLCRSWAQRSDSSFDLMWANLGAGKTHALFHLKYLLEKGEFASAKSIVLFAELPERDCTFLDIYRRLIASLPTEEVADLALQHESRPVSSRMSAASRAIVRGDENQKRLAKEWLTASKPLLRDLRQVTGIDSRIETDTAAEELLVEIVSIVARHKRRVVVLLDEFQRIASQNARLRGACLASLRSLISRSPGLLSVVVAVGSRVEQTAMDLLPPELKTLIGLRHPITLPAMNESEASEFIYQRLEWFRPEEYNGPVSAPFSEIQIALIVRHLAEREISLTPRMLLQVCGMVIDEIQEQLPAVISNEDLLVFLKSLARID